MKSNLLPLQQIFITIIDYYCHAERVNLADKTNLPRSLILSSDKQDN